MAGAHLHLLMPPIRDKTLEFAKYSNYLLALLARQSCQSRVWHVPVELTVNPSNACHLACPYCATGNGTLKRRNEILTRDEHRRIAEPVADATFIIRYFGTGEPLLNKHFCEMVRTVRDREIFSYLTTNLSIEFDDNQIADLVTCGLSMIGVSLDGASRETYGQYRRNGEFDLVVRNLQRLVACKKKLGLTWPVISWRFLVFEHNRHEVEAARELARLWEVDLLEFSYGTTISNIPDSVRAAARTPPINPMVSGPFLSSARKTKTTRLHTLLHNRPVRNGPAIDGVGEAPEKPPGCDWHYYATVAFPGGRFGPCHQSNHEKHDFHAPEAGPDFDAAWNGDSYRIARSSLAADRGGQLICHRCPHPKARFAHFPQVHRALLRNAPDWVLHIVRENTGAFYSGSDRQFLHAELDALARATLPACGADEQRELLDNFGALAARLPGSKAAIDMIVDSLTRPATQAHS